MKNSTTPFLFSLLILLLSFSSHAQDPPEVIWDDFFPGGQVTGNYTANDVKQSPYGGYVMVGSRKIQATNGYSEVMVMRVDDESYEIAMNKTFGGENHEGIPWDQVAYDMIITPMPVISYLVTGYRDTTLTSATTPPGLFLTQVWGNGSVLFDSLYFNNNLHHIAGRSIQPAIGGGYIIACSFREDGGGTDQTLVTRMVKNEEGRYGTVDMPSYRIIPVGLNGYARWIRQFGDGYLMGGTAYNTPNTKMDLFIQKLDADRNFEWEKFYGWEESDEFGDALIHGDTVYIAGTGKVLVPGTTFYKEQIYVNRVDASGEVVWENTYGGTLRHFANKIMMTGEGDLLVAGFYYDASMHSQMILMKIDAQTGDSLWTQEYGDFYSAGIRDAIRTEDYGYLTVGRANYSATQSPTVYVMKLDHGNETAHLSIPRHFLDIPIAPASTATDVINFTADADEIYGVRVQIDSLLHPSVGDLEVSISHGGKTATLADRPIHSGENFLRTSFGDMEYRQLDWDYAPYTGRYLPEDPLSVFLSSSPAGDWTLSVTDHGSGALKATSRVLEGWTLNLLTEAAAVSTMPIQEMLANFGLEQIRPNPIGQEAFISFRIATPGPVKLKVYNQLGQLVEQLANEDLPEGVHERMWQPGSLAPGAYFFHLESGGMISVRKAVLAR